MQQGSRYILFTGIAIGCISSLYFSSLLFNLPLVITLLFILASLFFLYRWLMNDAGKNTGQSLSWVAIALLVIGTYFITGKAAHLALRHGEWDAWAMWNFHSKYLADPHNWRKLFQNVESDHVDYPLCLPSCLGFFIRLCSGHFTLIIPFVFAFLVTLCIPVLIYTELAKRNIVIAVITLILFSRDVFFITRGVSQYADTLLAFFFLFSFVCMDHAAEDKKYLIMSALFLGCCAWTKNEGIVLALLFLLFHSPVFFCPRNLKFTALGLAVPVMMVLIQKAFLYATNDLVNANGAGITDILQQKEKYKMIYDSFILNLNLKFYYVKIGVYLYALLCIIQRKAPGRQILLLLTCTCAYMMVYLLSPNLDWQLHTSQDRIMHQLMPAFVYVIAVRFSKIQFALPKQVTF